MMQEREKNHPMQEIKNILQRGTTWMIQEQETTNLMQEDETNQSLQEIRSIHQRGTTRTTQEKGTTNIHPMQEGETNYPME
jgi:hypothetical protein